MKKVLFGALALFLSSMANAGWHTDKIDKIVTYLNGGIYVFVKTDHECGSKQIGMDTSQAGFKMVYSALLAYEAQNKSIEFAIQSCTGSIAIIDRIQSTSQP